MSFQSLHPRHSSFSNPSVALPASQLIIQPSRCFTYVTVHSTTLLLRHRIFTYVTWRAAHGFQPNLYALLILQAFSHFTYVTAHSPTLPSLYLRHSLFFNTSVASPTSQFILQPFFRFSYVTGISLTSPGEPSMLKAQAAGFYDEGIAKLVPRYEKCLSRSGDYVEKQLVGVAKCCK